MKKCILLVICIVLCGVLFAEEILWVTIEDTPAWRGTIRSTDLYIHNIEKIFPKDTSVLLDGMYGVLEATIIAKDVCIEYARDAYIANITVDGEEYTVEAKNIVPIDIPDLFDESFLTVAHYPSSYLITSYFADVLKSGTRSTMKKYEKDFIEEYIRFASEYDPLWWELSFVHEAEITQSAIYIPNQLEDACLST